MKATRFLLLSFVTFAALAGGYLVAFTITWSQSVDPHDPLRDVYVVKTQLAAEAASPRWLIVGGSSAWFGFDSETLAAATGKRVINLGVHADLPLWFQLEGAERLARPGDTVLLAAEFVPYWRARPTTFGAAKLGVLAPEAFVQASLGRKCELLGAIPPSYVFGRLVARATRGREFAGPPPAELMTNLRAVWAGKRPPEPAGSYHYLNLTPHGDFGVRQPAATHTAEDYDLTRPLEFPDEIWRDIAASARRLRERGVTCLFTWPPFERHAGIDFNADVARADLATVRTRLVDAGWRETGPVEDAMLAPEFFYDTAYHLTAEGARLRTDRLVSRLRERGLVRN